MGPQLQFLSSAQACAFNEVLLLSDKPEPMATVSLAHRLVREAGGMGPLGMEALSPAESQPLLHGMVTHVHVCANAHISASVLPSGPSLWLSFLMSSTAWESKVSGGN